MKLRIRSCRGGATLRLQLFPPFSLQSLRQAVASRLDFSPDQVFLSLNKKDSIQGPPDTPLSAFGICSGDLLFLLHEEGTVAPAATTGAEVPQHPSDGNPRYVRRELCAAAAMNRSSVAAPLGNPGISRINDSINVEILESEPNAIGSTSEARKSGNSIEIKDVINVPSASVVSGCNHDIKGKTHVSVDSEISDSDPNVNGSVSELGKSNNSMETEDKKIPSFEVACSILGFLHRVLLAESANVKTPQNLLIIFVHATMLETGFVTLDSEKQAVVKGYNLPPGWAHKGTITIHYILLEAGLTYNVILRCQLLGNSVIIYGAITGTQGSPVYRLSLHTQSVLKTDSEFSLMKHDTADLMSEYLDIFILWKIVKDFLALPLLTVMCERAGLPVPLSLLLLPTEVKVNVLKRLPALTLAKVGCTCSDLRHLSDLDEIWRLKYSEEFGDADSSDRPSFGRGWKEAFKTRWVENARRRMPRAFSHRMRIGFFPYAREAPPFFGVVGGDFDRLPAIGGGIFRGGVLPTVLGPFGGGGSGNLQGGRIQLIHDDEPRPHMLP